MPGYITVRNFNKDSPCRDTVKFFGTLATKLLKMAESIQDRIEKIKQNCGPQPSRGFLIAEIETPNMIVGVKYEYVEYIRRHGPPEKGIFDEEKLEVIRRELGINTQIPL
jgi:hypothetical protein